MRKTVVAMAIAAALAGCAAPGKVTTPNGSERVPVNSDAKIADFTARTAEEEVNARERSELARQVKELAADVASIKAYITAEELQRTKRTAVEAVPATGPKVPAIRKPVADRLGSNEAFELRAGEAFFRLRYEAKAAVSLSEALQQRLRTAGADCGQMTIRWRSDTDGDDPHARPIARAQANALREALVRAGVPASKVRIAELNVEASIDHGAHAARSYEIWTSGLGSSSRQALAAQAAGGSL